MSDEVRLYVFDGGMIHGQTQYVKMNQGLGEPFDLPVPWFLLTHPDGNVIIDGGNPIEVAEDPSYWGPITELSTLEMSREQAVVPALEKAGVDLASIRWIVQSHLHLDHTGAVAAIDSFPNAEVLVTRKEYEYAHAPDWFSRLNYVESDFVRPGVKWVFLDDADDGYDLFGDGTLRLWQSPGHSTGHQSFEVHLPSGQALLLTCDAAYTSEHWEEKVLPGFLVSAVDAVRSVQRLRRIAARAGAEPIFGHDPDQWRTLRFAPDYYS